MLRFKASSYLYINCLVKTKDLYLGLLESLSSSCFLFLSCLLETSSPAALTVPVLVHSIPSARCLVYYIHLRSRDQSRDVKPHSTLTSSKRLSGRYIKTKIPPWRHSNPHDKFGQKRGPSNRTAPSEDDKQFPYSL